MTKKKNKKKTTPPTRGGNGGEGEAEQEIARASRRNQFKSGLEPTIVTRRRDASFCVVPRARDNAFVRGQ